MISSLTYPFYHLKLRCYVVVELKTGAFKPEHARQLGFYLTAVDAQLKSEQDSTTIGLLLCKNQNRSNSQFEKKKGLWRVLRGCR